MKRLQMSELHKLSVKDKIKVVRSLGDEIGNEQSIKGLPKKHKKILNERLLKIDAGNALLKPWSEIQIKYRELY